MKTPHNRILRLCVGDFTSKVGSAPGACVGRYSKGERNENGGALVKWANYHQLVLSNTLFRYSMRYRTTWTGYIRDSSYRMVKKVYNMIDFVLAPEHFKQMIVRARSYGGTELSSDHKIVKADIENSRLFKVFRPKPVQQEKKVLALDGFVNSEKKKQYNEESPAENE